MMRFEALIPREVPNVYDPDRQTKLLALFRYQQCQNELQAQLDYDWKAPVRAQEGAYNESISELRIALSKEPNERKARQLATFEALMTAYAVQGRRSFRRSLYEEDIARRRARLESYRRALCRALMLPDDYREPEKDAIILEEGQPT